MKGEADGADQEAEVGREDENPAAGKSLLRHAAGVPPEILDASYGVHGAQNGCNEWILEATQEERHHHRGQKLQRVLVRSLNAVERFGVLVTFLLAGVHGGVCHIVLLASASNLQTTSRTLSYHT